MVTGTPATAEPSRGAVPDMDGLLRRRVAAALVDVALFVVRGRSRWEGCPPSGSRAREPGTTALSSATRLCSCSTAHRIRHQLSADPRTRG
jgi:hypothetical protein